MRFAVEVEQREVWGCATVHVETEVFDVVVWGEVAIGEAETSSRPVNKRRDRARIIMRDRYWTSELQKLTGNVGLSCE